MTTYRPRLVHFLPAIGFLIFLIIAGIALYAAKTGPQTAATSPLIGQIAPPLPELALNQSKEIPLIQFRGKPVLINFMASWCLPCRAEIPALDMLSDDIAIIAIAHKDKQIDTQAFLAEFGDPYDAVWMDFDGRAGLDWGIYAVPESFIIDASGRVVLRHAGPIFRDTIENIILPKLEELK